MPIVGPICDVLARIRFLETGQGGLEEPFDASLDRVGCHMSVAGQNLQCWILLAGEGVVGPGETKDLGLRFVDPAYSKTVLKGNDHFSLKQVTEFAEGDIRELTWGSDYDVSTEGELKHSMAELSKALRLIGGVSQANAIDESFHVASSDERLKALWAVLKSIPDSPPYNQHRISWRRERALEYVAGHLNAWPSTSVW